MANEESKIMTKPLPEILDELERWHNDNKALIANLHDMVTMLEDLLKRTTEAIAEAKRASVEAREAGVEAAAEAREAGLKAAEDFSRSITQSVAEVRKIAEEARFTSQLVGTALMTSADGTRINSEKLIEVLKAKFAFKK